MGAELEPGTRSSRLLYVVNGLAFVPVLGVAFGLLGVGWGLVSDRPRAIRAAALGALGIAFNLAACLGLGIWALRQESEGVPFAVLMARQQMHSVVLGLEKYHDEHGRYPDSLATLEGKYSPMNAIDLYDSGVGLFQTDRFYQYRPSADWQGYRLFSAGPDGRPDTGDDIYPELPDSLIGQTGLEPPPGWPEDWEVERADSTSRADDS